MLLQISTNYIDILNFVERSMILFYLLLGSQNQIYQDY